MSHTENLLQIRQLFPGYVHHWMYIEHGAPVMIVARYEHYGKKTYRQFRLQNQEWVEGMCATPYPLFGLQTLIRTSPFNAVLIAEGEKCSSILHQLHWPAIATVLGAQNPQSSDWNPLRHYNRFIILRDNDNAGISFARSVATEIKRTTPEAEVFVVNLVKDMAGGDLVDWLQSTLLRGQGWDGYAPLPSHLVGPIQNALQQEIAANMVDVKDCPHVAFKPIEALFDGLPRKFQLELRPVPSFPLQSFPEPVQKYLSILSSQFSQVPDYAGTVFIGSMSGLIGRSVRLLMRPCDQWYEVANSWLVLVGPPSAKKSPIMRRLFELFKPLLKRAAEEFRKAEQEYKKKQKAPKEDDEFFDEAPPIHRRYMTDDVTTAKLKDLLAGNPRGLILRNDELKGLLEKLDKEGNEGDRSFMMSCWTGLEDHSEDRVGRGSRLNVPLVITWIGCIPPKPLHRYLREAMGRGSGADGFMQRFQFITYPDTRPCFELPKEGVPIDLEVQIQSLFEQMNREGGQDRTLCFSNDAQAVFDKWLVENENNARSGQHPGYWESHLGKQSKAVAVLTIVLHRLKELFSGNQRDEVSPDTFQSALLLQSYFLSHARRCYESVSGGVVNDAEQILDLLKQKRLPPKFKAQEIYHHGLGGLSDSVRVRTALEFLQDFGWLAFEKASGNTGRHHEYWHLHPRAFEKQ
ncbi:MAG: DUF3987 domain-containing protein [Verrucomicrobia bacterium]|nr:DUF3987 domain-containing protein [Verrucomicrobiota bacterium]